MGAVFQWLHLTDLHCGVGKQSFLWPNVRAAFFRDLGKLHEGFGPIDAVLFSGDLTQRGSPQEFAELDRVVLAPLFEHLRGLGSRPRLVAIPGNHDLQRPGKPTAAVRMLAPERFGEVADELYDQADCEYRAVLREAFAPYEAWRKASKLVPKKGVAAGLLPGELALTMASGDLTVGVVGLNTAFLQLAAGDYTGRLQVDPRQLHALCDGDPPAFCDRHDACLLLTHHPPDWLDPAARQALDTEIAPAGRFVHLFGHMHESRYESRGWGGGLLRHTWQGSSLFSHEPWGEPPRMERRHGYALGRIEKEGGAVTLRLVPRRASEGKSGWRFQRDESADLPLEDDGATPPVELARPRAREPRERRASGKRPSSRSKPDASLDDYRKTLAGVCGALELTALPLDPQLATRPPGLQTLYLPQRVVRESAAGPSEPLREWQRPVASAPPEPFAPLLAGTPSPRLLVLGDPGSGKTTLLHWIAGAYLRREAAPREWRALPGARALPDADWIPVRLRCRDLSLADAPDLDELVRQAVRRLETGAKARPIARALRARLDEGRAILLVDGLDEIADPVARARFVEQLEAVARQLARAPIVVTCRAVGYRQTTRALAGFQTLSLAELDAADRAEFVRRFSETTEPTAERRKQLATRLARALKASERVARLASNPLLLATLAVVARRESRLPSRRHKLYAEAVKVLLHWRPEVDAPLDEDEVLPQLEYVAHAMCARATTQLRRDELALLLDEVRAAYPHVHAIHRHSPAEILRLLEARTGLVVEAGEVSHDGRAVPVYELRHLSIQEHLAAQAILSGHHAGFDRAVPLAARVAALLAPLDGDSPEAADPWREVVRLCVASCNDEDAEGLLQAVLGVERGTARLVLAAECLADEPNVGEGLADQILAALAEQLVVHGAHTEQARSAATELAQSGWARQLAHRLAVATLGDDVTMLGSAQALLETLARSLASGPRNEWLARCASELAGDDVTAARACLLLLGANQNRRTPPVRDEVEHLLALIERDGPLGALASQTLGMLAYSQESRPGALARHSAAMVRLLEALPIGPAWPWLAFACGAARVLSAMPIIRRALLSTSDDFIRSAGLASLMRVPSRDDVPICIVALGAADPGLRVLGVQALVAIGDGAEAERIEPLLADPDESVRAAAAEALGALRADG